MGSPAKKKVRFLEDEDDKVSKLPDELLHKIMSFVDAKEAVQTSVLSKRWKLVWTTLPFLNFGKYRHSSPENTYGFIRHVLSNRNHESGISQLKLCSSMDGTLENLVKQFVDYAIDHNVECLNIKLAGQLNPYKLSTLSSNSLKKLTLQIRLEDFTGELDCWNLPALTYLHLESPFSVPVPNLPESCLTCLPALQTLCLNEWYLSTSSFSFSLPHLTTLCLSGCSGLPQKVWNFPALLSLELRTIDFPMNMNQLFSKLVNLQSLTLLLTSSSLKQHHVISCPQLLNLNISILDLDSLHGVIKVLLPNLDSLHGGIKISLPKLCNFTSSGILPITFEVPELENVNIKLRWWFVNVDWVCRKKYYRLFTDMLSGLGNAKNLALDLDSIEALSATDFLASLPSPFFNLKTVKLPLEYKQSRLPGALRNYLLSRSPRATIVTTLPQNKANHQVVPVSLTSQKVMLDEPLTTSIKVTSMLDTNGVRQVGAPASNDRASSSIGNSDFGLWQGHEVKSEFVCLLDLIMTKYPETFEYFKAKSERFYTVMLNMLCTLLNEFIRTSLTELNTDIITDYKDQFADLQGWGFNVNWLVSHLNSIEQIWFSHATDSHMDDAKSKLQDLQTYFLGKITEIQKASNP